MRVLPLSRVPFVPKCASCIIWSRGVPLFKKDQLSNGQVVDIEGFGNGPISSLVDALSNLLNVKLGVANYTEHSLGSGTSTKAASYVHIAYRREVDNERAFHWGVGVSEDVSDASARAIVAAVNKLIQKGELSLPSLESSAKASA